MFYVGFDRKTLNLLRILSYLGSNLFILSRNLLRRSTLLNNNRRFLVRSLGLNIRFVGHCASYFSLYFSLEKSKGEFWFKLGDFIAELQLSKVFKGDFRLASLILVSLF